MHLHILGICGTFMGGVAALARAAGHQVSGSDSGVYPPMSEQLAALEIEVLEGYDPGHLDPAPDCVVIGNALSRGNPAVEYVLNRGLRYQSGPQWLAENVLQDQWVLAVAGTHGKTTTSSMLAWILEYAGMSPGFLIGGVPANFDCSARATASRFFVVEADEYDTAFFDKRSKFVHYRPRTLVLGNLEFDHADIFADLDAIKTQFHHLLRTVPGDGLIVHNSSDPNLDAVLAMGCWSERESFAPSNSTSAKWQADKVTQGGREFDLVLGGERQAHLAWSLSGRHNVSNAIAAVAAARHSGVPVATAVAALSEFKGVRRRMELLAEYNDIRIYDDFAHHPTAIASTLEGMRDSDEGGRILVILEPRSNTMRMGIHRESLAAALSCADRIFVFDGGHLGWDIEAALAPLGTRLSIHADTESIVSQVAQAMRPQDRLVIMSNGGFENLQARLVDRVLQHSRSGPDAVR